MSGMDFAHVVAIVARFMELAGIICLITGGLAATGAFVIRLVHRATFADVYAGYRADLGRAILLALEFLIAADIIGTIAIEPTFRSLGVLALIVLIRTFLSFTLEMEIHGRWPWGQQPPRTTAETA